jgi:hypothetical protein
LGFFTEWLLETSIYCPGCFVTADRLYWVLTLKIRFAEGLQQKAIRELNKLLIQAQPGLSFDN